MVFGRTAKSGILYSMTVKLSVLCRYAECRGATFWTFKFLNNHSLDFYSFTLWVQCYKTFYCRNLRIFALS
jgi:hypothetical protein